MAQSGTYLQAMADQKDRYAKGNSALACGKSEYLSNLQAALQNFQSQQGINANQYKQDAINRRATKYNLA